MLRTVHQPRIIDHVTIGQCGYECTGVECARDCTGDNVQWICMFFFFFFFFFFFLLGVWVGVGVGVVCVVCVCVCVCVLQTRFAIARSPDPVTVRCVDQPSLSASFRIDTLTLPILYSRIYGRDWPCSLCF
jgi:hypothetical protein